VLALCPPGVRVAAWHRGERPTRSRWPLHAWEPVLYHAGRQLPGARRADSIVHGVMPVTTLPGRVIGAKPAEVCWWIFGLLGSAPRQVTPLMTCFPARERSPGPGPPTRAAIRRVLRSVARRVR
jgi:hypothetical protein